MSQTYKVKGNKSITKQIFKELSESAVVKSSYLGETVLSIHSRDSGILYEPENREMLITGNKESNLLNNFKERIKSNNIILEEIV